MISRILVQDSGLCPFPLRRARCEHLRASSLHRPHALASGSSSLDQNQINSPDIVEAIYLVQGAGWHRSKAVVLGASTCAQLPCDRTYKGRTASPCPSQAIIIKPLPKKKPITRIGFFWCRVQDSNLRRHKPTDLQSVVFDRFTNPAQ